MAHLKDFMTPLELQKVSNLQVVARLVVEGFFSGLHKSPHKGFSIEFAQHRQYVQGDEIRRLDWKVFGKTDRYYIREFEEETNLRATILLDVSGSMSYEGDGVSKHHYATRLAASLAYLMLQQRDSVGLVTFDTKARAFLPQRSGVPHLRLMLNELESTKPGGETELGRLSHFLRDARIPLEVCPTSNVNTGVVERIEDHPIDKLVALRFRVTVNTDNRLMSGVTMSSEMAALVDAFAASPGHYANIVDPAFTEIGIGSGFSPLVGNRPALSPRSSMAASRLRMVDLRFSHTPGS